MRFAIGTVGTGLTLFIAGGIGALGSWAVSVGAVVLLLGGIVAAIALEEREVATVEAFLSPAERPADPAAHVVHATPPFEAA